MIYKKRKQITMNKTFTHIIGIQKIKISNLSILYRKLPLLNKTSKTLENNYTFSVFVCPRLDFLLAMWVDYLAVALGEVDLWIQILNVNLIIRRGKTIKNC